MKNTNTYSISDVAKILGLTLKATRRMVAAGQIKNIKVNNTYRIDRDYFDNNIAEIKKLSIAVENTLFQEDSINKEIEPRRGGIKNQSDSKKSGLNSMSYAERNALLIG